MNRRVTKVGVIAYVVILASMLVLSGLADRIADQDLKSFANYAIVVGGMVAVLIAVGILFVRETTGTVDAKDQSLAGGQSIDQEGRRPSRKRQWIVAALCVLVLGGIWASLISMLLLFKDQGAEPMMVVHGPFLTAVVIAVGISCLGPLRHRGQFSLSLTEWLPLATLLAIAILGTLIFPWLALRISSGSPSVIEYRRELYPWLLMYPLIATIIRLLVAAPRREDL
jgi:hypothetical protein